ncbi:MAG: ABC transporter permease [Dehalococcoidia bacterium]|nr:ABC transporter permease [Dehalococcoidia bacterium]
MSVASLPAVSYRCVRVWQRNSDVFLRLWKTELVLVLAEPLVVLVAMGYGLGSLLRPDDPHKYLEFLGPGILAAYAMYAAVFECTWGTYVRMNIQKTFDAIIVTPVSLDDVITGEVLWGATRAFVSSATILLALAVLGVVTSPLALLAPVAGVLVGLTFAALSVLVTSFVQSGTQFNYYFNLFITPMFVASGTFFPLAQLPEWVQVLLWPLPLTAGLTVIRGLFQGRVTLEVLLAGLWLVVLAAVCFPLAVAAMRRRLVR